jgi:hypothetical protein
MSDIGYSQTLTTKVIRRKHMIKALIGQPARSLKDMLKSVPDHATIDEVLDTEHYGGDIFSIEFHQEDVDHE